MKDEIHSTSINPDVVEQFLAPITAAVALSSAGSSPFI